MELSTIKVIAEIVIVVLCGGYWERSFIAHQVNNSAYPERQNLYHFFADYDGALPAILAVLTFGIDLARKAFA